MRRTIIALAALVSIGVGSVATAAAPPDDEAVLELAFAAWAAQNGTPVDRLACDVTEGEGNVCFVLGGGTLTAFVPDGADGWHVLSPADDTAAAPLPTTFGDGIHVVGTDIQPGTYRAEGTDGCYWARLSGFSGDDIITNDIGDGTRIVEIQATDVGFESSRCGTWTLVS